MGTQFDAAALVVAAQSHGRSERTLSSGMVKLGGSSATMSELESIDTEDPERTVPIEAVLRDIATEGPFSTNGEGYHHSHIASRLLLCRYRCSIPAMHCCYCTCNLAEIYRAQVCLQSQMCAVSCNSLS